jgi:hypothetical protein
VSLTILLSRMLRLATDPGSTAGLAVVTSACNAHLMRPASIIVTALLILGTSVRGGFAEEPRRSPSSGTKPTAPRPSAPPRAPTPVPPIQDEMTLTCAWAASTLLETKNGSFQGETMKAKPQDSLQFVVVDEQLVLVAKTGGGEKLHLIGKSIDGAAMFFIERTPFGNIVLWSFHSAGEGTILFMKQNNYGNPASDPGVVIWSHAGYCKARGGNGRALSR